jgi:hypothetical protein
MIKWTVSWHTWKLRHLNSRDPCSEDESKSEENRVFHFSMSATLRLVFDGTLFDRERNLLKRMTQIDVETTIRVMTTRKQMKNRNDLNIRTFQQSIEKEGIQQLLSRLFSTTRTTIIIRSLRYYSSNFNHLLTRRSISFHTIRIRREKTIVFKHLRFRFLIAVCFWYWWLNNKQNTARKRRLDDFMSTTWRVNRSYSEEVFIPLRVFSFM